MEFYPEIFKKIRKQRKVAMSVIAQKIGLSRKTLGYWENGQRKPNEMKIRLLAKAMDIPVNEISDLKPEHPVSKGKFSEVIESWLSLADSTEQCRIKQEQDFISKIIQQQKELRQASIVIKALLSSLHCSFYIKDTNLKYITANQIFLKNLSMDIGYQVIGKTDKDLFPEKEAKLNNDQDRKVIISGAPILKKEDYIPGTRKKKWGLISKQPIFDTEGKIVGLVGTFHDITDRKKAEEIRELLEENVNSMTEAISVADIKSKQYLFLNSAKSKIFGYPKEVFYKDGPDFWFNNCVHPDSKAEQAEYRKTGKWPKIRDYKILKPNGETRWVETIYSFPQKKLLGKECAITLTMDITERKEAEEIRYLLETSINASSRVVWLLEPPPGIKVMYVSESVNSLYGVPHKEFIGREKPILDYIHSDDKILYEKYWHDRESIQYKKFRFRTVVNGKTRWMESSFVSSLPNKCVAYIERDITDTIKIEENAVANAKLEMAKQLKSKGISVNTISEVSGLRLHEIEKI
jgi:PAS domain S-box-containing protein